MTTVLTRPTQPTTTSDDLEAQLADYRAVLTNVFAGHRHIPGPGGTDVCTCGGPWPCATEELACQLLDDWV